jgi:hypothetical protein
VETFDHRFTEIGIFFVEGGEPEGDEEEGDRLTRKAFGRGDSNLSARIEVDSAVSFSGDEAFDHVDDRENYDILALLSD